MSYLLDTCALSEMVKKVPDPGFTQWITGQRSDSLYISVVSIAEIRQGIVRLADVNKQKRLRNWILGIKEKYQSRLLPVDVAVAETYGQIQGKAMKKGRPVSVQDCWIAATALTHSLPVVTRDDAGLASTRALVFNPWAKSQ